MTRLFGAAIFISALATLPHFHATASPQQGPQLIAYYPLGADLTDVTGNHPPMLVRNAPLQSGKGIFCDGLYSRGADGCDVRTPVLRELNLAAFTISAQFLIPKAWMPHNPVFVAGERWRWAYVELLERGGVRLAYHSNKFVDCSVKYRIGTWHEATITFDGKTTTLYLDGVAGCSTDFPLETGSDEKVVLLTNSANASAFYGMFRELKIYNGVAVPPARAPLPDSVTVPPVRNLAPVDQFLAACPTRDQIASVDAELRLSFESDPTADEPLACTAAAGSRDLSPMKKRVYNSLRLMQQIQFDQPLPWTKEPLYRWFTANVKGIRFRSDIANSLCCNPDRTLGIATTNLVIKFSDRWVEPALGGGLDGFILLLVHEARHADRHPHTCGTKDQTLDEMGSWGVQYLPWPLACRAHRPVVFHRRERSLHRAPDQEERQPLEAAVLPAVSDGLTPAGHGCRFRDTGCACGRRC